METDTQTQKEVFEYIKQLADKGGDFIASEAPKIGAEVVGWYYWSSVFGVIVGSIFLILAIIAIIYATILVRDKDTSIGEHKTNGSGLLCMVLYGLSFVGIGIATPLICINAYYAVKASVAPRLVILEVINGMRK
jgi:hypothetical protein